MIQTQNSDILVSIIIPLHNDAAILESFIREVHTTLVNEYEYFEIILIDDASTDKTQAVAHELLTNTSSLRYIRLTRSQGLDISICAGFETAIGDYAIVLIPEFDNPEHISTMIEMLKGESSLVLGRSKKPLYDWPYNSLQRLYCWFCHKLLNIRLEPDTTYFIGLTRHALNAVNQIRDHFRYIKSFTNIVGVTPTFLDYTLLSRTGKRWDYRLSFLRGINKAIDIIVSNSIRPLRAISLLGLLVSGVNFAYFGYIALIAFFKDTVAEGWITLSTQSALSFFVLNIVLAVACEYLARLLVESKDRPSYFIAFEKISSNLLLPQGERVNVLSSSVK